MLGKKLNDWVLTPSGTEGMRTAEVCVGGVKYHPIAFSPIRRNL
jgi:predicted flavoprotein YhiN